MQGIVEKRKWRTFPWKRKRSLKRLKRQLRANMYKRGKVWTHTPHQQLHNMALNLGIGYRKLIDRIKAL